MKNFLIIGNQNAITYKEIFPLIKENKVRLGINCVRWFIMPNNTDKKVKVNENGEKLAEGARSRWFTNIEHNKYNLPLDLFKKYNPNDYPKFDNYDAINVDKVANIPMDYDGVIAVPITFLDKYCPTQFEIVGLMSGAKGKNIINGNDGRAIFYVNGKGIYPRILIRSVKES